jgi:hypothetical protein
VLHYSVKWVLWWMAGWLADAGECWCDAGKGWVIVLDKEETRVGRVYERVAVLFQFRCSWNDFSHVNQQI